MAQAYRQSAILMTACELKVFTYLSQGPMSAEALAHYCQVPVRGLQRLLNACAVLDLLEKEAESYYNTPIAETFLVQGKSGYMGNLIQAGAEQYEAWGHLVQAIQQDRPVRPHSAEALPSLPADRIRGYVARLYELGKHNAVAIADRVDLGDVQQMLDVAGGSGIYSITFAQRQPSLRSVVFDLPPIIPFAQEIIADHGMQERVTACPGNYFLDEFADGNDLVLLSNSLQTEGGTTCRMLLGKVFKALVPGGQLAIHGVMPNPDRVTPSQPALFPLQMLLSFPEGDAHPAEDICTWAAEAGFEELTVTRLAAPAFTSLILGRKPR
jgi:hypothetical protein